MSNLMILQSFLLALVMNIIISFGATSVLYQINDRTSSPFLVRHKELLIQVTGVAYVLFLFLAFRFHFQLDPQMTGYGAHWTFLNMILIAVYVMALYAGNLIQAGVWALIMAYYYFGYRITSSPIGVIGYFLFVGLLLYFITHRRYFLSARAPYYLGMLLFCTIGIVVVYSMAPRQLDLWFWVRQIGALLTIGVATGEYSNLMTVMDRHYAAAKHGATHDELTGLANYAEFSADAVRRYEQLHQSGARYTFLEIDLDHFKQINDTYGHPAGNTVLQAVARVLQNFAHNMPGVSNAYRLGGEEFGLLFDDEMTPEEMHRLGEALLQRLDAVRIPSISPDLRLTASIGCAAAGDVRKKLFGVYAVADQNLYLAKQAGRNRVCAAGRVYERDVVPTLS